MFQLKEYQQRALDALTHYLRTVSDSGDADFAFYQVTREVFGQGIPYRQIDVDELRGLPYVCLRMPTGAGKTYVASHAVGTATHYLLEADRSVVLWLVPTRPILEQTLDALKDNDHPYHQAVVDGVGQFRALDIGEALYLNRATVDTETVIIVSTIQAFRVEDTEGRKVYADAGALMDHFSGLPKDALAELECREDGSPIHSLANVLRIRRPIVIVDEAHNARTELSFEMLARFRPSCIIELTATPDREKSPSNVLHSVSAAELKAEEMIKLPIELTTKSDWRALLSDAVAQRDQLEKLSAEERQNTGEYIRPILLLQAEPNYSDRESLSVDVLKSTLIDDFQIPEEEIALATGASDDLEGVDILSADCAYRYVITVQKLKEGWDCPFAYVLCSVSEMRSTTSVEQIVGRILRMPRAQRKTVEELNKAYAFSASSHFADALNALKDVLVENGFERIEADTLVREARTGSGTKSTNYGPLFKYEGPDVSVKITVNETPRLYDLPENTRKKTRFVAESGTIEFTGTMTEDDREALKEVCSDPKSRDAVDHAFRIALKQSGAEVKAPVELGKHLRVPKLLIKQGDLFEEFEQTHILEVPWKLSKCDPTLPEFQLSQDSGQHGVVDVTDTGQLQTRFVDALHEQMILLADDHGWSVSNLVYWLDRSFPHQDIPPSESGAYLTAVVNHLIEDRGFSLDELVHHKYDLRKAVERRIDEHRSAARKNAYQTLLGFDGDDSNVVVDPERCFTFPKDYPYNSIYDGAHEFNKHFYQVVGDLNGEEEQCAQFLDSLPEVEYWVRNLERRPSSAFWLQTSSDKFYPDFVCRLRDERVLVVEYKGADRWSNDDSKEKRRLGKLWARRSEGKCLFVMPKGKRFEDISALVG